MVAFTTNVGLPKPAIAEKAWGAGFRTGMDNAEARLSKSFAGDPNGNVSGEWVGQLCFDTTGEFHWTCTTTGDAANAVWKTLSTGTLSAPSGTRMLFATNTPPTGWTRRGDHNDRVLMVGDGTDLIGGEFGGSWTVSGITVDGHKLTVSEMPSHRHQLWSDSRDEDSSGSTGGLNGSGVDVIEGNSSPGGEAYADTNAVGHQWVENTGGGAEHSHGLSSDGSWRMRYSVVVRADKD